MISNDTMLDGLNWEEIRLHLDADGYAMLPGLLEAKDAKYLACRALTMNAAQNKPLHAMDSGDADLLYFGTHLPAPLDDWRASLYRRLVVSANHWNEILRVDRRYPAELDDFLRRNQEAGQTEEQSYLSRLRVEDHLPLHQRNEGQHVFPLQLVALLSEPGEDFEGGEFVMTEQRPRMQSRPMVLPLRLGDVAIIATAERPFKGANGYYRVNLKHAISRVRKGERIGLELSFHNAP